MTYLLGLTGGIASGKSSASRIFKELDVPVIDADIVAREVVEPGTKGLQKIVSSFGSDILLADGTLDRKQLGNIIFKDAKKRVLLDALLKDELQERITELITMYQDEDKLLVVLDIPLLFEAGYDKQVDEIMLIYVDPKVQLERLMLRDKLSEMDAQARIDSQMCLDDKKEKSDIIIDNSGTKENMKRQVTNWVTSFKK